MFCNTGLQTVLFHINMYECVCISLSVFAVSVEAAVQVTDPLLQVVSVLRHHAVSDHIPLPQQPLKLISFEAAHPHRTPDHVFRVSFKVTQDADVVVNPKHAPLLRPAVHFFEFGNGVHSYSSTGACAEESRRLTEVYSAPPPSSKHRHAYYCE